MLLVSGCVGLGFALAENLLYFRRIAFEPSSYASDVLGRLLTANFLHIAFTGVLGLAFFRMCRWPKTRWEEFVGTFLGVVVVHGVYDALLEMGDQGMQPFALILMALVAYRYFHLANETREPAHQVVSPLGIFVVGAALITGLAWNYEVWLNGFNGTSIKIFAEAAVGVGIIGFIYINQLRDE